ncbi:MAG: hypothetical protein KGS60_19610 [Verrucomicrobia bacterium]|nr:hypothetical protein [Verrucomicrobiota bacterium]
MHDKSVTSAARPSRERGKPVAVVKQGSASVPIYRGESRGTVRFTLAFYRNGQRERRTFGNLDDAKEEARRIALNIQRGMGSDNDLRPQDREGYRTAMGLLAPLGLPLVGVIEEYVECRRKLGSVPLMVAVDGFKARLDGFEAEVPISRVVDELLQLRKQDHITERHWKDLQAIFRQFANHAPGPISEVTSRQIEEWIRRGDHSATTRNIWLKRLKYLFDFAKRRGYLPKNEPTVAECLRPVAPAATETGILKPDAMRVLMDSAPAELLPLLAIGGFAGLRTAEIGRLDWSAVLLDRRIIELRAGQAKTASRRIIPISENLAAWLEPLDRKGPVIPNRWSIARVTSYARKMGVGWSRNALRHSYISYRIAIVQNAAQVALEAGNSPVIIFKHYRELVTREEADEWFGIFPQSPGSGHSQGHIDTAVSA